MKRHIFCSILLFFISAVSYACENSSDDRKLKQQRSNIWIPLTYSEGREWGGSYNSFKNRQKKRELLPELAQILREATRKMLEDKKSSENSKTWPSFVDPDDFD